MQIANAIERTRLWRVDRNIAVPLTEPQKAGIASCPYKYRPRRFPSTFYKRINAGDRRGARRGNPAGGLKTVVAIAGQGLKVRKNGCYGQVGTERSESALACWG